MSEETLSINTVEEELGQNAVDRLRQAFGEDETISTNDLKPLLKMFNFEPSEEKLGEIIKKYGSSEGVVKYDEFLKIAAEYKIVKVVEEKKPIERVEIDNDEMAKQFIMEIGESEESTRKWMYSQERSKEKTAAYAHCFIWSMVICCCLCWCPMSILFLPCMCCCCCHPLMKLMCCGKCRKCHGKEEKKEAGEGTPLLQVLKE